LAIKYFGTETAASESITCIYHTIWGYQGAQKSIGYDLPTSTLLVVVTTAIDKTYKYHLFMMMVKNRWYFI
jgi:hypothetical protein